MIAMIYTLLKFKSVAECEELLLLWLGMQIID